MAIEAPEREATIEDLALIKGKAEIVNGKIITFPLHTIKTGEFLGNLFASLWEYGKSTKKGRAFGSTQGFLCDLPHRKSFCPDGGFYTGPHSGMKFSPEPPIFAVEVRSEGDYVPSDEEKREAKRADYFSAGTQIIWDVDLLSETTIIYKFVAPDATNPAAEFTRGEIAEAEPAVPGWTLAVDELFARE